MPSNNTEHRTQNTEHGTLPINSNRQLFHSLFKYQSGTAHIKA